MNQPAEDEDKDEWKMTDELFAFPQFVTVALSQHVLHISSTDALTMCWVHPPTVKIVQ